MSKYEMVLLEKERGYLLTQYARASENEKQQLLVQIMDIDERLELAKTSDQKKYVL